MAFLASERYEEKASFLTDNTKAPDAFKDINSINSNYHYRFYSTNEVDGKGEKLRIPVFLLNESDLALLLQATSHSQLPIIERMLKLALVFSKCASKPFKDSLLAPPALATNNKSPAKSSALIPALLDIYSNICNSLINC